MHLCKTSILIFYSLRYLLHVSNPRVLREDGCMYRYGIICLHAEITIKGFYKISEYKIFELSDTLI